MITRREAIGLFGMGAAAAVQVRTGLRIFTHIAVVALFATGVAGQDRVVAWLRADGSQFERELNQSAARGLRLAAITDGLPCAFAVLQTPQETGAQDEYRVVRDNDVGAQLPALIEGGFVPKWSAPGMGTRYNVIFERGPSSTPSAAWRVVDFARLEDLEPAIAAVAVDGYQARVLVRPPNRSWPGLSSRGIILAAKTSGASARDTRVIVGSGRDVADEAKTVSVATSEGWSLDLMFTSSRDGSQTARRERLVTVLSRDRSAKPAARAVTLERSSSDRRALAWWARVCPSRRPRFGTSTCLRGPRPIDVSCGRRQFAWLMRMRSARRSSTGCVSTRHALNAPPSSGPSPSPARSRGMSLCWWLRSASDPGNARLPQSSRRPLEAVVYGPDRGALAGEVLLDGRPR